jgi:hypothetical protein
MKGSKILGIILLIVGIIVLVVSLIADAIGIGGSAGFGFKQIIGAVVGAIAAIIGLIFTVKK